MKKSILTEFMLYRYRYRVGYGLFIIAVFSLLFVAGTAIPGALTQAEMNSAVASATISLTDVTQSVINLPYLLLQKASIAVIGLTPFAIKLPSLLLALATGIAFMFLLRRWFPRNVAILTAIVAVTASEFLIIAQSGTPTIMMLFWPTFMLLAATGVSAATRFKFGWKLLLFVLAALSLYTPLSIYILSGMVVAAALHPHLRFMVRRLSRLKILACVFVSALLLVPLGAHLLHSPQTALTLLGIPSEMPTFASLWANLQIMAHAFLGFAEPKIGAELFFPLYSIASSALILLGLFQLAIDHHSARTYTIGLWSIIMPLIIILQPMEYLAISFIPMLLMLAIGIDTLIREWYGLFPLNPYARAAALIPLVILLSGVVYAGVDRYTNSYRYNEDIPSYFSTDLKVLKKELRVLPGPKVLVVNPKDKPFYSLLQRKDSSLTVTTAPLPGRTNIVASSMEQTSTQLGKPSQFITNAYHDDSLRFLIYKTDQTVVQ